MESPEFNPPPKSVGPPPLDSLFPILRDLPRNGPRRELEGMKFPTIAARFLKQFLPVLLVFGCFPLFFVFIISLSNSPPTNQRTATGHIVLSETFFPTDNNGKQGNWKCFFLKYEFAVNGRRFNGATTDNSSVVEILAVGSPLEISMRLQTPPKTSRFFKYKTAKKIKT